MRMLVANCFASICSMAERERERVEGLPHELLLDEHIMSTLGCPL